MTPAEHAEKQQPTLKALLDDELPPWRRFAVRLHLTRCAACREELRAMQQIGEELRGQRIDPLDPLLRSRILATVREMTPEPVPARRLPSRRPALIWGGAAVAALFLAVVFVPHSPFDWDMAPKRAPAADSYAEPMSGAIAPKTAAPSAAKSALPDAPSSSFSRPAAGDAAVVASDQEKQETKKGIDESPTASLSTKRSPSNPVVSSSPSQERRVTPPLSVSKDKTQARGRMDSDATKAAAPGALSSQSQGFGGGMAAARVQQRQNSSISSPVAPRDAGGGRAMKQPERVNQPIPLEQAGFDLHGYRFVTQEGQHIVVPFKKSLNALRFARTANGKMALEATAAPPILYLGSTDSLANAAVPTARWQPLPAGATSNQPLYVRPAKDWEQFLALRWYPQMTIVGGWSGPPESEAAFTWLPGSQIRIGETLYPDFAAYLAYADAHPAALRLRAIEEPTDRPVSATTSPASNSAKAPGSARGKSHP